MDLERIRVIYRKCTLLLIGLVTAPMLLGWPVAYAASGRMASSALSAVQSLSVVVNIDGATLFEQPNGQEVAALPMGAVLTASGRSQDGAWLYVAQSDGQSGWLAAAQVVAFGVERLPILPVEIAPATEQTEAPTMEASEAITESVDLNAGTAAPSATGVAGEEAIASVNTVTEAESRISEEIQAAEAEEQAAQESARAMNTAETGLENALTLAQVTLSSGRLNIRSGPGTSSAVVGKAQAQETLRVLARNDAASWVQVALPGQEGEIGWVSADYVQLTADVEELPVSDATSSAATLSTTGPVSSTQSATPSPAGPAVETVAASSDDSSSKTDVQMATGAAVGLQGTLVFQTHPGGMIYAYALEDGRVWQLTHGFDPAISPDGSTVAFTRDGGQNGIYLIDIDGGRERLIFSGRSSLASPKWSPDGKWILFSRGDEYWECRTLGFGTCVSGNVFGGRPGQEPPPGFSLEDLPIMRTQEFNLAVVDTNGENYHDVAALETARTPDWNEAGIVYQSSAGIQRTADKPDAENTLVSFDYLNPYYHDPDWQPNGGRILFQMRGASHWEIYSMNPDGSNMTNLTRPVTALVDALPSNVAPAWSPDGQHIVFASNRGEDNSAGAWRLWVMDADGSNQHPLPLTVAIDYTFGGEQIVSWGP